MGLFQDGVKIVEKPTDNKTNNVNIKSLNGYGAIKENK